MKSLKNMLTGNVSMNILIKFLLRQTGVAKVVFGDNWMEVIDNGDDAMHVYVVHTENRLKNIKHRILYEGIYLSTAIEWLEGTIEDVKP